MIKIPSDNPMFREWEKQIRKEAQKEVIENYNKLLEENIKLKRKLKEYEN